MLSWMFTQSIGVADWWTVPAPDAVSSAIRAFEPKNIYSCDYQNVDFHAAMDFVRFASTIVFRSC